MSSFDEALLQDQAVTSEQEIRYTESALVQAKKLSHIKMIARNFKSMPQAFWYRSLVSGKIVILHNYARN